MLFPKRERMKNGIRGSKPKTPFSQGGHISDNNPKKKGMDYLGVVQVESEESGGSTREKKNTIFNSLPAYFLYRCWEKKRRKDPHIAGQKDEGAPQGGGGKWIPGPAEMPFLVRGKEEKNFLTRGGIKEGEGSLGKGGGGARNSRKATHL